MRIVYVSLEYPPAFGGGIGTYVHAVARTLAGRGHSVTVVTVGDRPYPRREIVEGVLILRLPHAGVAGDGPVVTLRCWQNRAEAVAELLGKLIRGGQVDLIEFADYRGEGAVFLAGTKPGERPVCVSRLHTPLSVLNHYNTGHVRHGVLEEYEHEALRASDRLVSPSRALAEEMRGRLGPGASIEISPHPVDPLFLRTPLADADRDSADVLYVGRFEERKGVETLAKAAPAFLGECPSARLVMIGGDTVRSPQQPSMRQVVRELIPRALRAQVELLDPIPREQLLERYRAARFCVFPSHFENFPNTCLEAMALGKCVVGTRNSGMAEIIEDGVSGVIVPSEDAETLAAAMIRLHRMSALERREMGVAARQRIESCYSADVIAEGMERLYAGFIAEHRRCHGQPEVARGDMDRQPPVAVVIPCYNHGRYLPDALASVRAQTYPQVECVIVDDGSTDAATRKALDQARDEGWRVITQKNQGLSAARNTGVLATTAPFYVPLDADDRLSPEFISRLLPPLLEDPTLGYCYGHVEFFDAATGGWDCPAYDAQRLLVENLSVATAVIRRAAFEEAGGYSRDMVHGFEDWDFWIALLSLGYPGRCVPQRLFYYRKHATGSMLTATQKRRPEMVRQMIEHHRSLFAQTLEVSIARKDAMFFQAHIDAWRMRETLAEQGIAVPAASTVDDELYQALMAKAELDYIENSRFWRLAQQFKRSPLLSWANRLRYGADWDAPHSGDDPRQRLAEIKSSRTYHLIQAIKRTAVYRWYGRRKYGADVGQSASRTQ